MGFFDSSETEQKRNLIKKMREKASNEGISSVVEPANYQKLIIEQNEAIINLLAVNAIAVSGMAGDSVTLIYLDNYYKAVERLSRR